MVTQYKSENENKYLFQKSGFSSIVNNGYAICEGVKLSGYFKYPSC